jgi:hypothetical protein
VNDRCVIRTQYGHRLVIVSGIVLAQFAVTDPAQAARRASEGAGDVILVGPATNGGSRPAGWPPWAARAAIRRAVPG